MSVFGLGLLVNVFVLRTKKKKDKKTKMLTIICFYHYFGDFGNNVLYEQLQAQMQSKPI